MSIQKITLATALLLSITACSSGGKGGTTDNTARQENTKLQAQVKNLEMNAEQAKKANEKAQQDLYKQIADLQAKADNAQKHADLAHQQLEQVSNNINAQELETLKQEAANAKKEAEKAKQDLTAALENFDKRVIDTVKKAEKAEREKRNQLFEIARNSGLPEYEADRVARLYTDLDEEAFNNKLKAREERRKALTAQASKAGLQDWEINNFINSALDLEPQATEAELNRLKAEKLKREQEQAEYEKQQAEREKTRKEIVNLGLENGLQEWEANNVAHQFQTLDEAKAYFDKYQQIIALAEEKGLDTDQAKSFAQSNIAQDDPKIAQKLDNYIQEAAFNKKSANVNTLTITTPLGYTGKFTETVVPLRDHNGFETGEMRLGNYKDIYNQQYSLVTGNYYDDSYSKSYNTGVSGLETLEKNLPLEGSATYEGGALAYERQGKLSYTVNFGTKEGQGTITEMPDIGTLTLEKGTIGKRYDRTMGIAGNVVAENWKNAGVTGSYLLDFYGPKAEEIAGTAKLSQDYTNAYNNPEFGQLTPNGNSFVPFNIGFGGTRGEIKK